MNCTLDCDKKHKTKKAYQISCLALYVVADISFYGTNLLAQKPTTILFASWSSTNAF